MAWISVQQRLPRTFTRVWVMTDTGQQTTAYVNGAGQWMINCPRIQAIRDEYSRLPDCVLRYIQSGLLTRKAIMAAHTVLTACCDDDISDLVGWMRPGKGRKRGFVWRPGSLPPENMVIIAQNLMTHGIVGKAKIRQLQRHESNETTSEFRATDYIMAARNHFGISREEAENLTMTEFALMLNAKYPNQKGFTRDEYDAVMDEDDRRWQAMMEKEKPR
ncbi:DUF6246 family protein [Raoultella terrigena]|uniref:DUF6246 family protein n=1 Tax=Raoultella terrigena TaxID=577 RepID=UPI00349FBB8E